MKQFWSVLLTGLFSPEMKLFMFYSSLSAQSIKEFYRMNCLTRRRHGLPPQPVSFFENIHNYIIKQNMGIVVLASYRKKVISGAIYFHFGKKAFYKYGASNLNYQNLSVLEMDHTMSMFLCHRHLNLIVLFLKSVEHNLECLRAPCHQMSVS